MRVAAYLRVSTDTQAEHGLGLDVQRQAIRAWARQHGHKIASWHSDEGISGSNGLDIRDALPDAVEEIRDNRTAGIVVYRLDRLARDLILQETLTTQAEHKGRRAPTARTTAGRAPPGARGPGTYENPRRHRKRATRHHPRGKPHSAPPHPGCRRLYASENNS
jgi:hypothetical protein